MSDRLGFLVVIFVLNTVLHVSRGIASTSGCALPLSLARLVGFVLIAHLI
jgi:hypothetical protein